MVGAAAPLSTFGALTVLRVRATGVGLAAGLALVAHLGLALGLDLGFVFDLDVA